MSRYKTYEKALKNNPDCYAILENIADGNIQYAAAYPHKDGLVDSKSNLLNEKYWQVSKDEAADLEFHLNQQADEKCMLCGEDLTNREVVYASHYCGIEPKIGGLFELKRKE